MPLSIKPTFLADIGPYLSPTSGNLSHAPTFCLLGQLPVPVVTVHCGVIYGSRSNLNDKTERDGEPTVQKLNVNKTSIYKINYRVWYQNTRLSFPITGMSFFVLI